MEGFAKSEGTALLKQGLTAAASGDRELARALFSQVAREHPSDELAWICLAEVSVHLAERIAHLHRALATNPSNTRTQAMLSAARKQLADRLCEIDAVGSDAQSTLPIPVAAARLDPENEAAGQRGIDTAADIVSCPTTAFIDETMDEAFIAPLDRELPSADDADAITINEADFEPIELDAVEFEEFSPTASCELVLEGYEDPILLPAPNVAPPPPAVAPGPMNAGLPQQPSMLKDTLADSGQCAFCMETLKEDDGRCVICGGATTIRDPRLDDTLTRVDARLLLVAVNRLTLVVQRTPQDARAHYELGLAYLNLNRTDAAIRWLQKAHELKQDPEIEAGLKTLASPPVKGNSAPASASRNSAAGNGTIPLHIETRAGVPRQSNEQVSTGRVVLVVDDSVTVRRMIALALERNGYCVVTAVDGEDGLKKMREHPVDMVLLDVMMPKLDGYQVCKTIRNENKSLPIVMLSGKDGFFDRVRGKVSGSTLYMTKPFDSQELLKIVSQYCGAERNTSTS